MQSGAQKSVSFAKSLTFISASSHVRNSVVGDLGHHGNSHQDNEEYDVSYYFCESGKSDSSMRSKRRERKYCSSCRTTHGKFSNEEGIERFFRNSTLEKRKTTLSRGEMKNDDFSSSEEGFDTRSSSESGETTSSSTSSLSIEGEKMYKCTTKMAKEKRLKMRLKSRDNARCTRLNVSRSSSYGNSSYGDGGKVAINIIMPAIDYDSDIT